MSSKPAARLPSARDIAAKVVGRVLEDKSYAAPALDAELRRYPQLDARERALATQLVYGTLRVRPALLARLSTLAPRGVAKGDPQVLAHLLLGAYQILLLHRIPAFAAVDETVGAVRKLRGQKVAGFANAVLRKLATSEPLDEKRAIVASAPAWLVERLQSVAGSEDLPLLLGAASTPPLALRVVRSLDSMTWLEQAPPGRASPRARLLTEGGDPRELAGYAEGGFIVQEEGAQVVGLALGVRPGDRVLDACAGRGQKTSLFAEQLGESGELWAADLYPAKLRLLEQDFERLRLPKPRTAAIDWTRGPGSVPDGFDRVLIDAPCTGTGTLRRRPEILTRLGEGDPERLGELAAQIVRAAAQRARAGARVVFAVCSVLREEAEAVVAQVSDVLEPAPFDAPELEHLLAPDATALRLLPFEHGTDGYFIASFRRR
ncbi:MAG TPA: transcription antitermination factor NusB [Polyangiaceae bacterium]|nr:transcription antitermination factor NusB [Polyangiaceae bacterium]